MTKSNPNANPRAQSKPRACKRDWETLRTMKLQIQKTLPEVINREQVQQVIDACRTPRIAACLWTIYSLRLRIEEGRNLQVGDVDSARMMVHVHRGASTAEWCENRRVNGSDDIVTRSVSEE